MPIWDEISKGLTDAANITAKKTGELTAMAKLKLAYMTDKQKLTKTYEEIGRKYFAEKRCGEDNSADIALLFIEVENTRAELAAIKEQAAKMKNVNTCESCGKEYKKGFAFCPYCGAKFVEPEPECDCCCDGEEGKCGCGDEKCDCNCDCSDDKCDCGCDCGDEKCDCGCDCSDEKCDCGCDCSDEKCDCDCDCGDGKCDCEESKCECGGECDCGKADAE